MNCLGANLAGGEAKPKDFKCWLKNVRKHIYTINSVSSFSLHITWCFSPSHKPNALILVNICKLAPHRIKTIQGEKQNDASHDILLITEIAFHKIKEDFLSNGDKSSTSFIEKTLQMLHPLTCVVQTKEIISFSKWAPSILPFHLLHIFPLKCSLLRGDLQEAMELSLKQKIQPGCSIWGNYQSGILLLGIKPSPSIMGIL